MGAETWALGIRGPWATQRENRPRFTGTIGDNEPGSKAHHPDMDCGEVQCQTGCAWGSLRQARHVASFSRAGEAKLAQRPHLWQLSFRGP